MKPRIQACLGGWCSKRGHCAHYHAANTNEPAERLCPPGMDGAGFIHIATEDDDMTSTASETGKPRQIHIPKEERLQRIVDLLTPEGITNADIVHEMGFTARARPAVLLRELKAQGRVFGFGLGPHPERFFPDAASCQAYAERLRAEIRERRAEACRRAQERYRNASGKPRKQLNAEAAQAKEETAKRRKATRIESLKVITKAAGQLAPTTGTRTAAAPKPRGPAFVQGEPDLSRARITVLPAPRGRFEVDAAPSVINSRECRDWAREAATA